MLRGLPPATNKPLTVERIPGTSFNYRQRCYTVLQPALAGDQPKTIPQLNEGVGQHPSRIAIPYDVDGKPHGRAPMRHPILSTGLMWSTAGDLARFSLAFTKALNAGHALIDQDLAEQLSIPVQICAQQPAD